jgi:monofunctional biosynthetic peptidoglycan transglycosylase
MHAFHRHRARRLLAGLLLVALAPSVVILAYRLVPPPVTPLMVIRMLQGRGIDYRWVPLERIAPALVRAVIAAEDNRFCSHFGFDVQAITDELDEWMETGTAPRGASTITQQTAKNILLWPGRDLLRKGIEAGLTPQIELLWSKRRIIEVYLNVIETGDGIYGAEAAAQRFFAKPARALTPREAALIAAVLPAPLHRSAARPSPAVQRRAARILARAETIAPLTGCLASGRKSRTAERGLLRPLHDRHSFADAK